MIAAALAQNRPQQARLGHRRDHPPPRERCGTSSSSDRRIRSARVCSFLFAACYADGPATNWAAERVRAEFPEFERSEPEILFTGEMMFRWMFEDYTHLRQLKEEAEFLAAYDRWPRMHDLDRLGRNEVPAAAIIYADDMYVDRTYSEETAAKIRGLKVWLTNEYEHNGIRSHGEEVLGKLLSIVKG